MMYKWSLVFIWGVIDEQLNPLCLMWVYDTTEPQFVYCGLMVYKWTSVCIIIVG